MKNWQQTLSLFIVMLAITACKDDSNEYMGAQAGSDGGGSGSSSKDETKCMRASGVSDLFPSNKKSVEIDGGCFSKKSTEKDLILLVDIGKELTLKFDDADREAMFRGESSEYTFKEAKKLIRVENKASADSVEITLNMKKRFSYTFSLNAKNKGEYEITTQYRNVDENKHAGTSDRYKYKLIAR